MTTIQKLRNAAILLLYACASLQFVRFYVKSSIFYLHLHAYVSGTERLPFQERVFPLLFLTPMLHSGRIMGLLSHCKPAVPPESGPFYLVSLVGLMVAAVFTQLLYRKVTKSHRLGVLVFPLFLFCVIWTYCLHNEANYSYPYDLLSLAFFTAGLYYIYDRRFVPLLVVMLVGTFNRETTLFLVGIYLLDSASTPTLDGPAVSRSGWLQRRGLSLASVAWLRVTALLGVWIAVKAGLAYHFRYNDRSEDFVRFAYNSARFKIRLFPALLNVCGYLLPIVLMYWSWIRPRRFANYAFILVLWIPIMFYTGVLIETRIYGELCSWTAVAFVLIAEQRTCLIDGQNALSNEEIQKDYVSV